MTTYAPPQLSDQRDQAVITAVEHHINYVVGLLGDGAIDTGPLGFAVANPKAYLYDQNDATKAIYAGSIVNDSLPIVTHLYHQIDPTGANDLVRAYGFLSTEETKMWDDNNATIANDSSYLDWFIRGDRGDPPTVGVPTQLVIPPGHNFLANTLIRVSYGSETSIYDSTTAHEHYVTATQALGGIINLNPFDNPIPNDAAAARYIFVRVEHASNSQPDWDVPEVRLLGTSYPPVEHYMSYDRGYPEVIHPPTKLEIPAGHNLPVGATISLHYGETTNFSNAYHHHTHAVTAPEAAGAISFSFASIPEGPGLTVPSSISRYIFWTFGYSSGLTPELPELEFGDVASSAITFSQLSRGPDILADFYRSNNTLLETRGGETYGVINGPRRRVLEYTYHNLRGADLDLIDAFWETSQEGAWPMLVVPHDGDIDDPLSVRVNLEREQDAKNPGGPLGPSYRCKLTLVENL